MIRKISALLTALLLVTSLPLAALADTWDLSQGDITISADESGQTVKQGENNAISDSNPTITGGDGSQTITVNAKGDAEAKLTIEDINAKTIEVGDSSATITVEGNNTVNNTDGAGIHVSSGDLTIDGDGTLEAKGSFFGAGIGSNMSEGMSGNITIEDNATVEGTGYDLIRGGGNMSGTITIGGSATVNGTSEWGGAGIGSGKKGEMSGTIAISNKAMVDASIGAGAEGSVTGTIEYFDPDPAPTQPEAESTAVYQVLNEDGVSMGYTSVVKDGVLTITVKGDYARLTGTVASLATLASWGYSAITLVTDNATSTFALADLMAKAPGTYALTHSGKEATLTLNGETLTGILK